MNQNKSAKQLEDRLKRMVYRTIIISISTIVIALLLVIKTKLRALSPSPKIMGWTSLYYPAPAQVVLWPLRAYNLNYG